MIDLTLLRQDPEFIKTGIFKKDPSFDVDKLCLLDEQFRSLSVEVESLRKEKNDLAKSARGGITPEIRERSIEIGKQLKRKESLLQEVQEDFMQAYQGCPNIADVDVPNGNKEANVVVKTVGQQPTFSFDIKDHLQLGEQLDWFDFSAAAKVTGSNFAWYKGDAVRLLYALTQLMIQNNIKHGYEVVLPPYLANTKSLEASGQLPKFADGVYKIEDEDLYLIPTAEVNLLNYYRDDIFLEEQLPKRLTSWTGCFRREAGNYGHAERGLIRIHEFEKVELVSLTTPEDSAQELDRMIACAEDILQQLGLHYQVVLLAGQDTSFQSFKTYDIEVWMPGQKSYYEVSSASNCIDFQARRGKIRYKKKSGEKASYLHTLNASSLALPRLMVALMETYQQADGSIGIPDCLKKTGWF